MDDDEEMAPKRPLEDAVDVVSKGCRAMKIIEAPASSASVSSSDSVACVDKFELLVAAEEGKEDEFVFV